MSHSNTLFLQVAPFKYTFFTRCPIQIYFFLQGVPFKYIFLQGVPFKYTFFTRCPIQINFFYRVSHSIYYFTGFLIQIYFFLQGVPFKYTFFTGRTFQIYFLFCRVSHSNILYKLFVYRLSHSIIIFYRVYHQI